MKKCTLCILIDNSNNRVLLGMKKRGFGEGKWNGFGGKVNESESVEDAVRREMLEESSVQVNNLQKAGELTFKFSNKPEWDQIVHVYKSSSWKNEPVESEEMLPKWFSFEEIPYSEMWIDDIHWLPKVLNGENVNATFIFNEDGSRIEKMSFDNF